MATAQQTLARAAQEIGYYRHNDPLNGTKYGRWYAEKMNSPYFGYNGVPFCAMFVSYILDQVGQSCPGFPAAYCPYILNDTRKAGIVLADKTKAQPGDLVIFNWDGGVVDHIGFVELNKGSYIQTIEGNSPAGYVSRRTRNWGTVAAIVRVPYGGSATPAPAPSTGSLDLGDAAWWGRRFNLALQGQLGTSQDGVMTGQATSNKKFFWAVDADAVRYDGDGNSLMVKALQRKIVANGCSVGPSGVDGHMGRDTIRGLQSLLVRWGYSVGASGADGYCGNDTNRAVAQALKDGRFR